jgi:hypothetical protein
MWYWYRYQVLKTEREKKKSKRNTKAIIDMNLDEPGTVIYTHNYQNSFIAKR